MTTTTQTAAPATTYAWGTTPGWSVKLRDGSEWMAPRSGGLFSRRQDGTHQQHTGTGQWTCRSRDQLLRAARRANRPGGTVPGR